MKDPTDRVFSLFIGLWFFWVCLWIVLVGVLGYVLVHFIAKAW